MMNNDTALLRRSTNVEAAVNTLQSYRNGNLNPAGTEQHLDEDTTSWLVSQPQALNRRAESQERMSVNLPELS